MFKNFLLLIWFCDFWNLRILKNLFSLLRVHNDIFIFHFNINFILYQFFINCNHYFFLILLSVLFVFLSFSSKLMIILNRRIGINIFFVDFLLFLRVDAFRRNCLNNLFLAVFFRFHVGILFNYNLNILKNLFFLKR